MPPTLARRLRPVVTEPRGARALAAGRGPGRRGRARARHRPAFASGGAPKAVPATTTATAIAAGGDGTLTAPLDRSPDFYAWLASPDAERLAME